MIVVEVIRLLREAFGSHARKGFEVTNKMRLVREVEGTCYIGQSFKLPGFDESYRFIKPLHPNIGSGGKTHRVGEASFKLAFRYIQGVKQVFDRQLFRWSILQERRAMSGNNS